MSDIESSNWSETAASNTAASPNGWPSNSAPTIVYSTDREMMGAIKREWNRSHPTVTSGGAANVQTLTYTTAPAAYVQGQQFTFIVGFTNTGATTLNVNSLGAKNVFFANAACTGGELILNQVAEVVYDGTQFQIMSQGGRGRGAFIGIQSFTTAGSFTYTPSAGTNFVVVEVLGGCGGGGGAALTGASQVALGSAGSGGGYSRKKWTSGFSGATVVVGAAGTAGTAGNNAGGNGGNSSFNGTQTATGGSGGAGSPAVTPPTFNTATGGQGAAGGDLTITGGDAGTPFAINSTFVMSGRTGHVPVYGSVKENTTSTTQAGTAGTGMFTGGTGGINAASQSAVAGAAGSAGAVFVWEYA